MCIRDRLRSKLEISGERALPGQLEDPRTQLVAQLPDDQLGEMPRRGHARSVSMCRARPRSSSCKECTQILNAWSRRGVEVSATQHRPRPRNRLSKARAPRVKAPWTDDEAALDRRDVSLDHHRRLLGPTAKPPWTDSEVSFG